jgi:anti-sigma-K factor RskA
VDAWEARLLPLTALAPAVEPSAPLWDRIARSVAAPAPVHRVRDWWSSLFLWRGMAGAGFALAAILAAVLLRQMAVPPATPQYLVVLVAPQDKAPGWVVQARSPQTLDLIPLASTTVPVEKTLQFWTKADGWSGPKSLGLVQPGQVIHVPLDQLPPLEPNQLFELTLEPAGGSPLDRPTGPIQFIGRAVKVT